VTDDDYRAILRQARSQALELGLSGLDERITSAMRGSDGPFYDLLFYLKHLREEVQLGSDTEYRETLRRVRRYVRTESGEPVAGVRIEFTPTDADRYGMENLDLAPSREFGAIAEELEQLIEALREQHERDRESGEAR